MSIQICRKCLSRFEHLTRGRPPVLCTDCRGLHVLQCAKEGVPASTGIKSYIPPQERLTPPQATLIRFSSENASTGNVAKTGSQKQVGSDARLFTLVHISDIVRCCSSIGLWDKVVKMFKSVGGSMDIWGKTDWEKMSYCLTCMEDEVENEVGCRLTEKRIMLRDIRRKLEYTIS